MEGSVNLAFIATTALTIGLATIFTSFLLGLLLESPVKLSREEVSLSRKDDPVECRNGT